MRTSPCCRTSCAGPGVLFWIMRSGRMPRSFDTPTATATNGASRCGRECLSFWPTLTRHHNEGQYDRKVAHTENARVAGDGPSQAQEEDGCVRPNTVVVGGAGE